MAGPFGSLFDPTAASTPVPQMAGAARAPLPGQLGAFFGHQADDPTLLNSVAASGGIENQPGITSRLTLVPLATYDDGSVRLDKDAGLGPLFAGLATSAATAPYEALKDVTSGNLERDAYAAYGGGAPTETQTESSRQDAQADVAGRSAAAAGSVMSPSTLETKPEGALGAFGGGMFDDFLKPDFGAKPTGWTDAAAAHLDKSIKAHLAVAADSANPTEIGIHSDIASALQDMKAKGPEYLPPSSGNGVVDGAIAGHLSKLEAKQSAPNPLAALYAKMGAEIDAVPTAEPVDFSQHLKPIDWEDYLPQHDAYKLPPLGHYDNEASQRATALGYNTSVPLYKGMGWHAAPGEGLGETGGFADPASKPNERAIFAADQASIAQSYAHSYNVAPMYARADKAFEVNWPDVTGGNPSYDGTVMQNLIDHARSQGADALAIHNIHDLGGLQTQYAFMDPSKLRVRHAAFSPDAMGSSDLLSARGVPGLPSSGRQNDGSGSPGPIGALYR